MLLSGRVCACTRTHTLDPGAGPALGGHCPTAWRTAQRLPAEGPRGPCGRASAAEGGPLPAVGADRRSPRGKASLRRGGRELGCGASGPFSAEETPGEPAPPQSSSPGPAPRPQQTHASVCGASHTAPWGQKQPCRVPACTPGGCLRLPWRLILPLNIGKQTALPRTGKAGYLAPPTEARAASDARHRAAGWGETLRTSSRNSSSLQSRLARRERSGQSRWRPRPPACPSGGSTTQHLVAPGGGVEVGRTPLLAKVSPAGWSEQRGSVDLREPSRQEAGRRFPVQPCPPGPARLSAHRLPLGGLSWEGWALPRAVREVGGTGPPVRGRRGMAFARGSVSPMSCDKDP